MFKTNHSSLLHQTLMVQQWFKLLKKIDVGQCQWLHLIKLICPQVVRVVFQILLFLVTNKLQLSWTQSTHHLSCNLLLLSTSLRWTSNLKFSISYHKTTCRASFLVRIFTIKFNPSNQCKFKKSKKNHHPMSRKMPTLITWDSIQNLIFQKMNWRRSSWILR